MAKNTKINRLMLERGIEGKDVCKGTGLNKAQVSLIANGRQNITMATLVKLCRFFKCTPNEVLDYEKWLDQKPQA